MSFVDRELQCLDCGQNFVFTAGEQEFYERKGFREEPKRCKPCRETRKTRRNGAPAGNGNGRGQRDSRGMNGGGGNGGALEDDDNIGNRAGAPGGFDDDARGNRFGGNGGGGGGRGRGRSDGGGGGGGGRSRELFEATCAQCGGQARVPFRPAPGRPVYCRDCFASRGATAGVGR